MAFTKVKLTDKGWIWRCTDCGKEHPPTPVKEHELGPAPHHDCPYESRFDMKPILADEGATSRREMTGRSERGKTMSKSISSTPTTTRKKQPKKPSWKKRSRKSGHK